MPEIFGQGIKCGAIVIKKNFYLELTWIFKKWLTMLSTMRYAQYTAQTIQVYCDFCVIKLIIIYKKDTT